MTDLGQLHVYSDKHYKSLASLFCEISSLTKYPVHLGTEIGTDQVKNQGKAKLA
jgi:hypothetical protein